MSLKSDPSILVGKKLDGPEATAFLAKLDPKTKVTFNDEDEPEWFSKKVGTEIRADKASMRIITIHVLAQGEDEYEQYPGPLPNGLTFAMNKEQATACFSLAPRKSSAEHDCWVVETQKTIVMYNNKTGRIRSVTFLSR
jgi:hypothetical protein